MPNLKKIATWLVIAFIAFTIISSPDKAADMTHTAFGGIASAGRAIGQFFSALTSSS